MRVTGKDPIARRIEVVMEGYVVGHVLDADTDEENLITVLYGRIIYVPGRLGYIPGWV